VLALVAMVAGTFWPRPHDDLHWIGQEGSLWYDQVPWRVLDVWGRWDTMFYWSIARSGYPRIGPEGAWVYHAAYFPLFPSMMRGLSVLLGGLDPYACGLLLAFGLFGLAVVYLDRLVRLDETPEFAELVVLVLMAYPGSHFLTCVYPESTTLFLAVFAVYCARTGKPLVAGLACMLAVLARSSGVFICVPVLFELLRQHERFTLSPKVLVLGLPVLSLGFWVAMNQAMFGDPLYFVHVQGAWGRHPSFFLAPLLSLDLSLDYHFLTLSVVALTVYGYVRRERAGYLGLSTLNALLPLSTGMMRGIHRYMGSNFPLFIFLARFFERRKRGLLAYVIIGLGAMVLFAFKWGQGNHPN
jgi:hypothetical protein